MAKRSWNLSEREKNGKNGKQTKKAQEIDFHFSRVSDTRIRTNAAATDVNKVARLNTEAALNVSL